MKTLLRLLPFLTLALVSLHAAEDRAITAARAADDERLLATKSGDRARLDAIFSNELHYAHSNGKIDTKASYMESLVSKRTVYESFDYKQRDFKVAGPGVVIMTAHVLIKATNNGARSDNDLNILAVWREENGKWRFFAWQSCKNPPATPAATK
ncbi:MAG: nuclear transport factor 2 family protein [Opitutaceae bacterium]